MEDGNRNNKARMINNKYHELKKSDKIYFKRSWLLFNMIGQVRNHLLSVSLRPESRWEQSGSSQDKYLGQLAADMDIELIQSGDAYL
jgi:hypothetical protein